MKLKKIFGYVLLAGILANSVVTFADETQQPVDLYHKSLGKECSQTAYPYDKGKVQLLQVMTGVVEAVFGAAMIIVPTPAIPAGLVLAGDGIGRMIGGNCAGLVGLDDLILMPVLGATDQVVNLFSSSPKAMNDSKAVKKNSKSEEGAGNSPSDTVGNSERNL